MMDLKTLHFDLHEIREYIVQAPVHAQGAAEFTLEVGLSTHSGSNGHVLK